ncbi:transposase family protein [Streptomyces sp. NBC_01166]|uniref:transposase family protein n=1 Tax=Streptomyces sp. NBC_01166 TaxID=2903755 RepID=UPI003868A81D|nr:transposase family protein [Streptomyces sp. NBC_01166]
MAPPGSSLNWSLVRGGKRNLPYREWLYGGPPRPYSHLRRPDTTVLSVDVNNEAIRIEVHVTTIGSECPDCGSWSSRVHSSYLRFLADVPTAGRRVAVCLHIRRFFCPNASRGRLTFVEQVLGLTRRHTRRSECLRQMLAAVGLALAGRAGARMAWSSEYPSAAAPCCGWSPHCPSRNLRPHRWLASSSTPRERAASMPRSGRRRDPATRGPSTSP